MDISEARMVADAMIREGYELSWWEDIIARILFYVRLFLGLFGDDDGPWSSGPGPGKELPGVLFMPFRLALCMYRSQC